MLNEEWWRHAAVGTLAGVVLLQSACVSDDAVHARAKLVDRTTQGLLDPDILSINGAYSGCIDRLGNWSQEVAAGAALSSPELSVIMNDVGCVLTLTELVRTGNVVVVADLPIVLDTTYELVASEFGAPVEFYGNARVSAIDYAADFVITFLYSDDSNFAVAMNTALVALADSSVSAQSVQAPEYTLNIVTLILTTDVDDLIVSVTGQVGLVAGAVTGQRYVLLDVDNLGAASYEDVDAAFIGGTDLSLPASIPAFDFQSLVGQNLAGMATEVRTLIISNTVDGVASYQVHTITFVGP
jgi:hypothetical protein